MCRKPTPVNLRIAQHRALLACRTCCVHGQSSTLCLAVSRPRRKSTVQLNLAFLDIPSPSKIVLETLDEQHRLAALEVLARLIAQAAHNDPSAEGNDDD